jgi:hypothetical protein
MAKIPVYENEEIVAEVDYNADLDHWDGHNYSAGSTGRHLGIDQLEDGRYVLIHGTQWQGESDSAEIVSDKEALQAILRSGQTDQFEYYPELAEMRKHLSEETFKQSKSFSIRVNANESESDIDEKLAKLRQTILDYFKN